MDTTAPKLTDAYPFSNIDISPSTNNSSTATAMTDKVPTNAKLQEIISSYTPTDDKFTDSTRAMVKSSEGTDSRQVFTDPSNPSVSYISIDFEDYSSNGRPPHRPPHRPPYVPTGGGGFGPTNITPLPSLPQSPNVPFVELVPVHNPGPDPGTHDNFRSNGDSGEASDKSSEEGTGNNAEKKFDDPSTDSSSTSKEKRRRTKKYNVSKTEKASVGTTSTGRTESTSEKPAPSEDDMKAERGHATTYTKPPPKQEINYSKNLTNLRLLDVFGRDITIKINRKNDNTSKVCFRATESNKPDTNVTERCVIFQRRGQETSQSEMDASEALKVEGSGPAGVLSASTPDVDGQTNDTETSTTVVARESVASETDAAAAEAEANRTTTERHTNVQTITKHEEYTTESKKDDTPAISTTVATEATATERIDKKRNVSGDVSDDTSERVSTEKLDSENSTTESSRSADTNASETTPKDELEGKTESYKQLEDTRVENVVTQTNGNNSDAKELQRLADLKSTISNQSWTDGNVTEPKNEDNSTQLSFARSNDNEEVAVPEGRDANDEPSSENVAERAEDGATTSSNEKNLDSQKNVKISPEVMLELLSTITRQERQPPPPLPYYNYYFREAGPPPPLVLPYEYDAYQVQSNARMVPDYIEYPESPLPYNVMHFPVYGK